MHKLTSVPGNTGADEPHGASVWMGNGGRQLVPSLQYGTTDDNMCQNECALGESAATAIFLKGLRPFDETFKQDVLWGSATGACKKPLAHMFDQDPVLHGTTVPWC